MSSPQSDKTVSFRAVVVAVVLGTALVVAAMVLQARRPERERDQATAARVEATGKCAECHRRETSAVVHEFEMSKHAAKGTTCLDCHAPAPGQVAVQHKGFAITKALTSKNCAGCHAREYDEFARSRHAGPAWAAIAGPKDFTKEQLALGEKYHKGWVDRPANGLAAMEGNVAQQMGCNGCHIIGKPNADGSFGTCTPCHARHAASVALAREPTTCGQCHVGPDHSQIEIYEESKHGAIFVAQRDQMNLHADPARLSTQDMPVPTCATCHMSGLEGMKMTHDTTERLSWYLFAAVSTKRPDYLRSQNEMKAVCEKCHAADHIDEFYKNAERVVAVTNDKVQSALAITDALRKEGLLSAKPFDEPVKFTEFDLWHYYGRTAKHGAFMGGADFVQWHGNYQLLAQTVNLEAAARALRSAAASQGAGTR